MPVDFHQLVLGKRMQPKPREGTELGFLVQERQMCWRCYGSGCEPENHSAKCAPCRGSGFIVEERSLPMALAALNIVATENSEAIWVSKNVKPVSPSPSKYHGLKVFAFCPQEITKTKIPYAFILKINNQASLVDGFDFLSDVIGDVMSDFFRGCATEANEVCWLYRDLNKSLYLIELNGEEKLTGAKKIANDWDGSDYDADGIPRFIDNRLQLMIQDVIFKISNGHA